MLKKAFSMISIMGAVTLLISCDKDNSLPCVDEPLANFNVLLIDEDDNLILEEEDFDAESLKIFGKKNDEWEEIENEVKETSEGTVYLTSSKMTKNSLEDGMTSFELRLEDDVLAQFEFVVKLEQNQPCKKYSFEAKAGEDTLETTIKANVKIYKLTITQDIE
ncbi:hypothetical protein MM239_19365 [Belliella sp. DSM 111904]|uniref:DUF5004 domain-containing protein n=1 Tax=Belliella filtrata TaxID=2923435 RepID=A0ABS9V5Y6_9BACT|nr:hypothetical protein [Belliella filtrata]MCH7411555.1 hypothetical protein [Belliella filtrata]